MVSDDTQLTIDIYDPSVYCDLTKPVGALNPTSLSKITFLAENSPDSPFHYGTTYSFGTYVSHCLICF
jgi:factor associated with neutral sphingomyelinase activation